MTETPADFTGTIRDPEILTGPGGTRWQEVREYEHGRLR